MKIYNFLIPLLIFSFGLVNCGRDLFGTNLQNYPGDLADTRFNNVILEHDYQWLIGNQESLWDLPFFYPEKNMLAGSDNHLGTFLLYVPFRLAGFTETRSFQAWVFVLFVLNFFVFYKVARKLGLNATASATGAFLFTFSMPVLGSVHHIQTLCKFSFPLVIYFFYRILFHEQKKNLVWFTLSLVHLFYCSLYYGMFTLLLLMVFFIVALFQGARLRSIFSKQNLYYLIASFALLLLLVPLLLPYNEQQKFAPHFTFEQMLPNILHPYSYMMPHWGSAFYGFLVKAASAHTDIWWGHIFFIGLASMALLFSSVYFLRKEKRPGSTNPHYLFFVLCGITLLLGLILTTAVGPYSFYQYIMKIDAFNHLKVMNRVFLIELFFAGILVAYVLNRISFSSTKGKILLGVLSFLVCAEHWMQAGSLKLENIHVAQHRHEYLFKAIDQGREGKEAFVVLRAKDREPFEHVIQIDAMMAALQKKIPTVNGYTTIADPSFYNVHTGTRKAVMAWFFHKKMDTLETGQKILFIP